MQNGSLSQRVIALHHCLHSEAEWCDYQLESPTPESPYTNKPHHTLSEVGIQALGIQAVYDTQSAQSPVHGL